MRTEGKNVQPPEQLLAGYIVIYSHFMLLVSTKNGHDCLKLVALLNVTNISVNKVVMMVNKFSLMMIIIIIIIIIILFLLCPPSPTQYSLSSYQTLLVYIYHLRITLQPRLSIYLFLLPYMCPSLVGYIAAKPLLLCLSVSFHVSSLWVLFYVCLHFTQGV